MKLLENILLALCVSSMAIGVHQLYYYEVGEVYWILSLSVLLFLVYTLVRSKNRKEEELEKNKVVEKSNSQKQRPQPINYDAKESSKFTPPKKKRKKKR